MKTGDKVELTENQIELLKSTHRKIEVGRLTFEQAGYLVKNAEEEFWCTVGDIIGKDKLKEYAFTWSRKDPENPILLVGRKN